MSKMNDLKPGEMTAAITYVFSFAGLMYILLGLSG